MLPHGQDFFSLGELLLLALAAGHALALVAALHALGSRRPHGRTALLAILLAILRRLAIVDGVYFLIVLATTLSPPEPVPTPHLGDAICHAHRCVAVVSVEGAAPATAAQTAARRSSETTTVTLTLRLSNGSRYASRDPWPRRVFVLDDRGARYPLDTAEAPLTAPLDAGEVRTTARRFTLPAAARPVGFFVDQSDGSAPALRCLIVGGSCWYAPPPHRAIAFD